MKKVVSALLFTTTVAAANVVGTAHARADETIVVCKGAVVDPVTALGCVGVAVISRELMADRPFGPNGAVMQVLRAPVHIVSENIRAADRESGEISRVIRGTLGISVRDINKFGIFGGPNSLFRKPLG